MSARQQLHRAVEALPDSQIDAALSYLNFLSLAASPVLRALLSAPPDDEPDTDEDQRRDLEAVERFRRGESIPHEEVLRE